MEEKNINDIITKKGDGINGYITNFAHGGLRLNDMLSLNSLISKVAKENIVLIDVGVAKGSSSAVMGFRAKELNGKVYSVDDYSMWKKNEDQWEQTKCSDIFLNNMKYLEIDEYINLIIKKSEEACKDFEDESADLIFLDASHWYPEVVKDINNWYPKVKKGGILCGHDCQMLAKDGKIDIRKWQDVAYETVGHDQQDFSLHVGVILAVADTLPEAQHLSEDIWWIQKN